MIRDLSPHAVAHAARCRLDDLRGWRRHGLLDDYGERIGKGWLYSREDAACIAVALFAARHGLGMREGFALVRDRAAQLFALCNVPAAGQSGDDYFVTISFDSDTADGYAAITSAPARQIKLESSTPGALQVNVAKIVRDTIARVDFYVSKVQPHHPADDDGEFVTY